MRTEHPRQVLTPGKDHAVERGPETPSERVEAELRAMLAGMRSGQALPPVREQAKHYEVSTATVSKAR